MKNLDDIVENGHFCFVPFEWNMLQWVDEKMKSSLFVFLQF